MKKLVKKTIQKNARKVSLYAVEGGSNNQCHGCS